MWEAMQQSQSFRKHRKPFVIDVQKMKRWHGAPPLFAGQDEADFCAFIKSLEACVEYGDGLTQSVLYRYGVETYTMGQLLAQRSKLMNVQRARVVEFARRDTERQKHRENKQRDGRYLVRSVWRHPEKGFVSNVTYSESQEDVKRGMHYEKQHKLDEMSAAAEFESAICLHAKIDSAISRCAARTSELLHQIALHGLQVAERVENEAAALRAALFDEQMDREQAERLQRGNAGESK